MTFVIWYFVITGPFFLLFMAMGFRARRQLRDLTEAKCLAVFTSEQWKTVEEVKLGLERQIGRPMGYLATNLILLELRRKGLIAWTFRQDGVNVVSTLGGTLRGINRIYQFRLSTPQLA